LAYPRYITGEHAAPPEDCGGIPGFYAQLEISAIPIIPITKR
jgi:Plasmid pRiA4b ORF-3-like protein